MQYDVFISYSRKDTEIANRVCEAFDKVGITYFIDRQGIGGGFEFPAVLAEAILNSHIFLFLASKNSYESKFTQAEITFAFNKKDKACILPYIIDGSTMPNSLEFVFSAINWRRIEEHPIETVLLDDLLNLLEKQKNTDMKIASASSLKKRRWLYIAIACIVALLSLLVYCMTMYSNDSGEGASTTEAVEMSYSIDGYEYVDLGLSVKWATCNIGASSPEDYGDCFMWGDIVPTTGYADDEYSAIMEGSKTKGGVIAKTEYDVAYNLWSNNWRMPTYEEALELTEKCTWDRTELNDINGYCVTGPNGNRLFLPATGMTTNMILNRGEGGYYWTSTNFGNGVAKALFFYGGNKGVVPMNTPLGFSIRPVTD